MRKPLIGIAVALTGAIALAAAAVVPAAAGTTSRAGKVTGTLELAGGPYPGGIIPQSGKVIAISKAGHRYAVRANKKGKFALSVPPGRYHLIGYPSAQHGMRCDGDHTVRVTAGGVYHVNVVCPVP